MPVLNIILADGTPVPVRVSTDEMNLILNYCEANEISIEEWFNNAVDAFMEAHPIIAQGKKSKH
jgi:hypothetical protein